MNRVLLVGLVCLASFGAQAEPIEASGCVPATGNVRLDNLTARAKAKGQLSLELGSTVSAETTYSSQTKESRQGVTQLDDIRETVTLSGSHTIGRVNTVRSGYETVGTDKLYCVHIKMEQ